MFSEDPAPPNTLPEKLQPAVHKTSLIAPVKHRNLDVAVRSCTLGSLSPERFRPTPKECECFVTVVFAGDIVCKSNANVDFDLLLVGGHI